jgi:gamma-glutamyltranspeptidase
MIHHRMDLAEAVAHPRVHCQGSATFVDARVPAAVRSQLEDAGHEVIVLEEDLSSFNFGRVCVAERRDDGSVAASAGPAWLTAVAAV